MCLGIPGRVVAFREDTDQVARVDVMGATRDVNVALVRDEGLAVGDWVLIHVGFAMAVIDEEEAALAFEGLRLMGRGLDEEPEAGVDAPPPAERSAGRPPTGDPLP